MPRNGLIFIVLLSLMLSLCGKAYPSWTIYSDNSEFKNFQEGLSLIKLNKLEEALAKFKKSQNGKFILSDYSKLFMAAVQRRLSNNEKALSILEKLDATGESTTKLSARKLYGEISLELGKPKEAFDSFAEYYSRQPADKLFSRGFKYFVASYKDFETTPDQNRKFLDNFIVFANQNLYQLNSADSPGFLEDILYTCGKTYPLSKISDTAGKPPIGFKLLREYLQNPGSDYLKFLNYLVSSVQKAKDYRLKIKILKEISLLEKNPPDLAKLEIQIALAYLNANMTGPAIQYLNSAARKAGKNFTRATAYYYIGRIQEDLGQYPAAYGSYKKIRGFKYQTEDDLNLFIKSLFRAGWVNFKHSLNKKPSADFKYILDRFGVRVSEDGYIYWLGRALVKEGKKEAARKVFESLYSDYPLSYYGLLCGLELKNNFAYEPVLKQFSVEEFVQQIAKENEKYFQRSILLYTAGLEGFAKSELSRINIDYNNTGEIYLLAILNMFLEDFRKSVSLIDYIINQKKGLPGEDTLKLYYPLKYMTFISPYSSEEGVDPFMILSLIRQESVFLVDAVSKAGAMGLMQILPSLGLKIAQGKEFGDISEKELLNPTVNLKVGISHFAELMKKFGNNFIYAIAAYNSSETKVKEWRAKFPGSTPLEFTEDIPYFETKKYVKMNVRNYLNYLRIYSDQDWTKALPAKQ